MPVANTDTALRHKVDAGELSEVCARLASDTSGNDALERIAGELERIGGSRAQLDLVEFTLLQAYVSAHRLYDARRMLSVRRRCCSSLPVAGLAAVH